MLPISAQTRHIIGPHKKEDAGISLCFFDSGLLAQSRPQITRDLDLQKPHVPRKQIVTALRLSNSNSNSNSNIAYFVNSHILHTFIIKWVDFIIVNTKIIFLHNI